MIHLLCSHSRQEIKAEVFNYQQINKMETINSIRQFCNEGPVMVKQKNRNTNNNSINSKSDKNKPKLFEIVAKFVVDLCLWPRGAISTHRQTHGNKNNITKKKSHNKNNTHTHTGTHTHVQ